MTKTRFHPFSPFALAILAVALATFASCRAREGTVDGTIDERAWTEAVARLDRLPDLPSPLAGLPFWIGGWVGPPVRTFDEATWRTFREAGFDVSMGPLEDRRRREDNVDRLAALERFEGTFAFVRDDSVHPDEATRPGWEDRARAIVAAYSGFRALAGYFLADEPLPADRGGWTPVARLLRRLDPAHPAYVNFLALPADNPLDRGVQARWRDDLEASLVEGDLPFFTFDAYPFLNTGVERPHFLATLRDAALVSHETSRPFGAVLQFTGHGNLRAVSEGEASYLAMEALAHGASCVIWFTYWTPNPGEGGWKWNGGVIENDGTLSADRYPMVQRVNRAVRTIAAVRGSRPMLVTHLGAGLPEGLIPDPVSRIPDVDSVSGPAATIGFSGESAGGERRYVLVHRDTRSGGDYRLRFDAAVDSARVLGTSSDAGPSPLLPSLGTGPGIALRLEPGGAAVIATWRTPGVLNRRSSSRSGTR